MDTNTATWIAGLSGGVLGAVGAFGTALGQRAWDRKAAERLRTEEDRAARLTKVHDAVARLFAAIVDLQLTLGVATTDHVLGFYGRHATHAVNRLPDIMSRVLRAATEIQLAADDEEIVVAVHVVLERLMAIDVALRSREYRKSDDAAVDALNQAAVELRDLTRAATGLSVYAIPEPRQ